MKPDDSPVSKLEVEINGKIEKEVEGITWGTIEDALIRISLQYKREVTFLTKKPADYENDIRVRLFGKGGVILERIFQNARLECAEGKTVSFIVRK